MSTSSFLRRHIGISEENLTEMFNQINVKDIEQLVYETIPDDIRLKKPLNLPEPISEYEFLEHIHTLGAKNKVFKSYIGLGYHESCVPAPIQRNILENPGWYTAYTPYQAEIAQGRLEALLNYQTMVIDLTGMEVANASLLDESTAAAEAMTMLYAIRSRAQKKANASSFFVSEEVLPQTLSLLKTRAIPLGINIIVGDHKKFNFSKEFYGALIQYPGKQGAVFNYEEFVQKANSQDIKVAFAADILSLALLKAPGSFGADVVVGTTQRFGIPLGYGGPHAAYFATKEAYKRNIPGRIIGISKDREGNKALRMALQTREQHIKRDKATSNICTAQVLLAVMAGVYAVYHGPKGLKNIANTIHFKTTKLESALNNLGIKQNNENYFDTLSINVDTSILKPIAESYKTNFYYPNKDTACVSINEATSLKNLNTIIAIFSAYVKKETFEIHNFESESKISDKIKEILRF